MSQNLPDPSPYAQKGEGSSATKAGGQEQIGSPNTARSTKGAVIPCGEFTFRFLSGMAFLQKVHWCP